MSKSAGFFIALLMVVAGGLLLFKLLSNGDGQVGQGEATIDPDWQPKVSPTDYETGTGEPWITEFELVDLLYYFKLEPINIKGCFGYGLKEIVKQLYALNLIEEKWEDNTNGLDAMVQILKISEEAENKNIPIKRFHKIKRIIYYNYMDCKVIIDILKMLEKMI